MNGEWSIPWQVVDDRRRAYIGGELGWELSHFPDHPLARRVFTVVAMKDKYDHAIIQFDDGSYGYVQLSWRAEPPRFETIGGPAELSRFLYGHAAGDQSSMCDGN